MRFEAPKVGKKDGKKLSDTGVLVGMAGSVSAGGRGSGDSMGVGGSSAAGSPVSVGLALTGRLTVSLGTPGASVLEGSAETLVVATMASSMVWSSSCSVGNGCRS